MRRLLLLGTMLAMSSSAMGAVLGERVDIPLEWTWYQHGWNMVKQPAPMSGIGVASDGTNFVVVWSQWEFLGTEGPNGEAPTATTPGIFAIRLDPSGNRLEADAIRLADETAYPQGRTPMSIAYAAGPDAYLAVWRCSDGTDACFVRLAGDGTVIDSDPVRLPSSSTAPPIATTDGVRHFVLLGDRVAAIEPSGEWTISEVAFTAGHVAWNGRHFLNLTRSGWTVLSPSWVPVASGLMPNGLEGRAVTSDGTDFVVLAFGSGAGGSGEYSVMVDEAGALVGIGPRITFGMADASHAISFDGRYEVGFWCPTCVNDRNPTWSSIIDGITAAETMTIPDMFGLDWFDVTSNATGVSMFLSDGYIGAFPYASISHFPRVRFLTTWAPLSVKREGKGGGHIGTQPVGLDCGQTCLAGFDAPTEVTLTATPNGISEFTGWSGACTGSQPTCSLTTDAEKSVTAYFSKAKVLRRLYVSKAKPCGQANGIITSVPSGIDCGSTCSGPFAEGRSVKLSARSDARSVFKGWSGACSGTGDCIVSMWEAQYVTATFEPANFNLVVTNGGGGKGLVTSIQAAVSCPTGKTCTVAVANGATVTLRATAGADSVFRGWSDACTGTGDCTVTMTGNRSVGATIEPATYLMQVIPQGSGVGTVTSAPVGIVCGKGAGDCLENWPNGTVVILRAEAPPGFKILRWTDAGVTVCAGAPECRFTMTRSRFIGAVFGVAH